MGMYWATLISPEGEERSFYSDSLTYELMLPYSNDGSKPLYLARIRSFYIDHDESKVNPMNGAIFAGFAFSKNRSFTDLYLAEKALSQPYVVKEFGVVTFYGDPREYLMIAHPSVFDSISEIITKRNYYGKYEETLPGPLTLSLMKFFKKLDDIETGLKKLAICLLIFGPLIILISIYFDL